MILHNEGERVEVVGHEVKELSQVPQSSVRYQVRRQRHHLPN